jgi:hypothetical protein
MNAKQITFKILDEYPIGATFRGIDLMYDVRMRTGEVHYPDTMLRYMREYRRKHGRGIVNINKAKSVYQVVG